MSLRSLLHIFLILLIGGVAFLAYHYHVEQQKTLLALQLKLKLLEESKKEPVQWQELLKETPKRAEAATPPQAVVETAEPAPSPGIPIDRQATSILAQEVNRALDKRESLSLDQINRAIDMAEELIRREPDSYSAYKAKLILLLTKESGLLADIDDAEVEDLLGEMADFDMRSNAALRKEAFLISRTNTQIDTVDDKIDDLESDLDDVDADLDTVEGGSTEEADLLEEARALERRIDAEIDERDRLEDELEADLATNEMAANEDIIEIPLQRGLATGDYDAVISQAEALLDEFGESVTAYYYLIRALELDGQTDAALDVIADSGLSAEKVQELQRRLRRAQEHNPRDYWKRLRF